jgi:hypothetical protein
LKLLSDFATISLNPNKCEVLRINPNINDNNISIDGIEKEYLASKSFIKYLGVPGKLARLNLLKQKYKKF